MIFVPFVAESFVTSVADTPESAQKMCAPQAQTFSGDG